MVQRRTSIVAASAAALVLGGLYIGSERQHAFMKSAAQAQASTQEKGLIRFALGSRRVAQRVKFATIPH